MSIVGNYLTAGLSFHVPATGMTLDRFSDWTESDDYPQCGKIIFFQGELYFDMSPERIDYHSALKEAINVTISTLVRRDDLGRYYPDGVGLQHKSANLSAEPDALFATWDTIKSGKLIAPPEKRGKHTALVGAPDWVCEIVSDASVEKDTQILRTAYHAAGIPEYWLIDAREELIDFQILVWNEKGYVATQPVNDWHRSPVFALEFQLTRHRDQVGWWKYDLEHR